MILKNTFANQPLKDLKGPWKDIAKIFQRLCTNDGRKLDDGTNLERIKIESLPIATFLNCVSHIVNAINNEFGAMDVRGLYDALHPAIPHKNTPPSSSIQEYEYCCNRFYERTVIFAAVYYVISVENPELQDVLTAIYKQAYYHDGAPYLNQFTFELRNKINGSSTLHEEFIPPHIIPDVTALMDGYREFKPYIRLKKFRLITAAIESLPQDTRSAQTDTLYLVITYAIRCLKRTFNLSEDAYIPDNEKVTISTLLEEYKKCVQNDENGSIAAFLERVIKSKEPSAQDPMYLDLLEKAQRPVYSHPSPSDENEVAEVLTSEVIEDSTAQRRGPRFKYLFLNEHGQKDETRTKREAQRVMKYLSTHHLSNKKLDSSKENKINVAVANFWHHWNDRGMVMEKLSGAAFYRFLTEDCGLACDVGQKPFSSVIKEIVESGRNSEIYADEKDFFIE